MKINEIFYSIQGEGHWAGTAAVFVRFSGCNLRCPFCDTDHSRSREMSEDDIVAEVVRCPARHVVFTGGEPALQLTGSLVDRLHREGMFIQAETNGLVALPSGVDWITCSPKELPIVYDKVDELKVLFHEGNNDIGVYDAIEAADCRVQPCDTGDDCRNRVIVAGAMEFVKNNPKWRLSVQLHKLLGFK